MPSVAIVGASPKPERYSHQAVLRYRARGYTVYPVHPAAHAVAGIPGLATLDDLPQRPDIISMYVNPQTGLKMLAAILAWRPDLLWLNPGAASPALAEAVEAAGVRVVQACNLVALSYGDPLQVLDSMDHTRA